MNEYFKKILNWISEPDDPDLIETPVILNEEIKNDCNVELVICNMPIIEDIKKYGQLIKEGKLIIIDISNLDNRTRFIDFLSGVALASDVTIIKLDESLIICIPKHINLSYIN